MTAAGDMVETSDPPNRGQAVAAALPRVRRYARALTGDQRTGDLQVGAALSRLREQGLDPAIEPDLQLFRALHGALPVEQSSDAADSADDDEVLRARIMALPANERGILLLCVIEGFTLAQAAWIIGIDVETAGDLLSAARADLRAQRPTAILVIEDEAVIALDIASIVGDLGHRVLGVARTRADAVALARRWRDELGLVIADIQLADKSSGLDAVNDILGDVRVPTVFVTAFPERLLTGERPEPTFLLTKPFDADILSVTISQALVSRPPASAGG